jgi:Kef-type K+ transport system membrane component KefB
MKKSEFVKTKLVYYILSTLIIIILSAKPLFAGDSGGIGYSDLLNSVGIAFVAATVMAIAGHILRQPLILAYIAAGIVIGPKIGLGLIKNLNNIETISQFGLILLLFSIGLEIDIKKLKESGKSLIISGFLQFPITVLIGIGFFYLLGYNFGNGRYDLIYLAACCGLSSTAIVVKLLYNKFELDTLAGRITIGILVFQNIWIIILLRMQPNLSHPAGSQILYSFLKGGLLVFMSMLASKYVLPRIFKSIAKLPELVLVASLGWCFCVCGAAAYLNLSLEMGALIAGVAISTFPYNLDVISRVVNMRDFFVTLFFVSLGMKVPNPLENTGLLVTAGFASIFLILSRFISVFPFLYSSKNSLRISLLPSINLAQISEFSLVIASIGVSAGHIGYDTFTVIIFIFVITSVISTYTIKYNDPIQKALAAALTKIGIKDMKSAAKEEKTSIGKEVALLGFHRTASSLIHEIAAFDQNNSLSSSLKDRLVVIDFNPEIFKSLQSLGIKIIYGDISNLETLQHAGIHDVKIVISTIPDTILVGTDNLRIIRLMKEICPYAKIIVTAESAGKALKMYAEGADYVFVPSILTARNLMGAVNMFLKNDPGKVKSFVDGELEMLQNRHEVMH